MKELKGSEKQIRWAEKLREEFVEEFELEYDDGDGIEIEALIEDITPLVLKKKRFYTGNTYVHNPEGYKDTKLNNPVTENEVLKAKEIYLNQTDAGMWINNRDDLRQALNTMATIIYFERHIKADKPYPHKALHRA